MTDKPEALQDRRADFVHFAPVASRWTDNDVYGHVNNVVYYAWFDTIINRWLISEAGLDPKGGSVVGLCVESKCRFLRTVGFPDDVEIGLRVDKLGSSSVRFGLGVFRSRRENSEELCASAYVVHVFVDRDMKPVTMPASMRKAFERLVRRAGELPGDRRPQ